MSFGKSMQGFPIEVCIVVFRITDRIARIEWGDYVMVTDTAPNPFSLAD